jgi:YidC/Oxa1 family membrane protein insertase
VNLDQEKRVMLAFVLSIVMLMVYRVYFMKEPPPEAKKTPAPAAATTAPGAPAPAARKEAPAAPPPPVPAPLSVIKGAKAEEFVVESPLYRVTFSTVGAVVRSWVLKGYPVGELTETVDSAACNSLGYPISLDSPDPALKSAVNQGIYLAKSGGGRSGSAAEELVPSGATLAPPVNLTFTYSDSKIQVIKRFTFGSDNVAKVEVSVFDGQNYRPAEVIWPGGFGDQALAPSTIESSRQGVYGSIGDLTTVAQTKIKQPRTIPGPLQLGGLEDKFFAAVFLPEAPDQVSLRLARQDWAPADWTEKDKPDPLAATLTGALPRPLEFRLFVGPKALDVLKLVNPPLDSLANFGWFSLVAKPLFIAMRYIYDHWVHNYGWAIVILTVLITAAMYPLKLKSLKSAQEMQKVQPIIKGIQDKYKSYKFNDPRKQKMNEEVMKVYSEHHINPFGSCVPMLLQMPLLYGFYEVLGVAIELRHAPWIFYIKDLSAPDCLMIMDHCVPVLVILMAVASYFLQQMTPMATVDPSQQRMMKFMPVIFAFMFYKLPSGMVLYWLTSSVMQILQQLFINRKMPPPPVLSAPRKTAEAKA